MVLLVPKLRFIRFPEFWAPAYDPPDLTVKTKKLQFVTNFEETETFKASMYVKNTINEDQIMMQKCDEDNISIYEHESAPDDNVNPAIATSTNFSFLIDIESDRQLDINELLFSYNSLSGLQGINQPYSADSHYFSSRSEIGFTGSSSDTEDGPHVPNENGSTSDSVGEMRWSSPDSVSIVQEADVNALASPNDDEHTIITKDQEDTSILNTIVEPNIEAPKPAKRKNNGSTLVNDQQPAFSEMISKEADALSSKIQSPTCMRTVLADMPLEAIQERSVEEDGTAYQSVSEIQESAELPYSTESGKKMYARGESSSSDLRVNESAGNEHGLESSDLEGKDEKSKNNLAELMKSSSINSDFPRSISESPDYLTRSDEQKLFIATDRTSGYNTMTSSGGRISQSGLSALDQRSFHSPREEATISDEPELVSQSSVTRLSKMDGRELNIDLPIQNLIDDEIKKNDSMGSKILEIGASPEESQLALRTKVVGGSMKQETLTSSSALADLLTQSNESKTNTLNADTNLGTEYLSIAHEKHLKHELGVPVRSELRNKNDSIETLSELSNTFTKCGMIGKPPISELPLNEDENEGNTTGKYLTSTTENPFIPESIKEGILDDEAIKEYGKGEVTTKQEKYELLATKNEKVSPQLTQGIDKRALKGDAGGRITPKETVQFDKSELMSEESIFTGEEALPPIKNTSENKSNQQSGVKSDESNSAKISEVTYPDSTANPKLPSSTSATAESKSRIELQNQLSSEQSSKKDPISTTKQIAVEDEVSKASFSEAFVELSEKDAKPTVPLPGEPTTIEKKTASDGESAKETLSELSNAGSKVNSAVTNMEDSGDGNLVKIDLTKVGISDPGLSLQIYQGNSRTESSQLVEVKEKAYNEIATNLNPPNIKRGEEDLVSKCRVKEDRLDAYLDHGPKEVIETSYSTSSSSAEDKNIKTDTKAYQRGAPKLSNIQQKSAEVTFNEPFKMQEAMIKQRIELETDADLNSRRNKNETLQEEEKEPTAGTQENSDEIEPESIIAADKGRDTIDMAYENKLKEGTEMWLKDKMKEIKQENFLHPLKESLTQEAASLKLGPISLDKQAKSVPLQEGATKLIKVLKQSSPYPPVNEESSSQHIAKNILTQIDNSDHKCTGVPLRQMPLTTAPPPMTFVRKSTVEQKTEVMERKIWRTNAEPRSQRPINQISVEKASTRPIAQPTIVTVKVNTKEVIDSLKEIRGKEVEMVKTELPTKNTTPRESVHEEIREDNENEHKNLKKKIEIIKVSYDITRNAKENNQLEKFPMPLKCASPFSDSDCDPEITSWTMARPWYLLASDDAPQSHVPPVIALRTKSTAVKSSNPPDKNNQKGNNQSGLLTPKFYPASVAEAMKTEAAPILRRNAVEIKAKAEHRFSSFSISDGEEQKSVEFINAETGSTSSRSRV
ncbi:unnamed protein product [Rodentolepis nana]|uniref:C2 NT-type domain-containing protein n=1 Tax=Rodentolepis nana TaxID=102285 RepID=A0A0R3TQS4_RODNA|nr:unnamed protein product [Rodentolepis nana]